MTQKRFLYAIIMFFCSVGCHREVSKVQLSYFFFAKRIFHHNYKAISIDARMRTGKPRRSPVWKHAVWEISYIEPNTEQINNDSINTNDVCTANSEILQHPYHTASDPARTVTIFAFAPAPLPVHVLNMQCPFGGWRRSRASCQFTRVSHREKTMTTA